MGKLDLETTKMMEAYILKNRKTAYRVDGKTKTLTIESPLLNQFYPNQNQKYQTKMMSKGFGMDTLAAAGTGALAGALGGVASNIAGNNQPPATTTTTTATVGNQTVTENGTPIPNVSQQSAIGTSAGQATGLVVTVDTNPAKKETFMDKVKQYWYIPVIVLVLVIALIWYLKRKKK